MTYCDFALVEMPQRDIPDQSTNTPLIWYAVELPCEFGNTIAHVPESCRDVMLSLEEDNTMEPPPPAAGPPLMSSSRGAGGIDRVEMSPMPAERRNSPWSPVSERAMRTPPVVTVVIPTFNRAAMLREALASVRAQEGAGAEFAVEVIVVDDASSDDTPAVVHAYPHVRYVRLPANRGHSAARNAGIKAGTGEYLAFLDDDDVWLPHWLQVMVPALEAHPDAALAYGQVIMRTPQHEHVLPQRRFAPSGSVLGPLLMGNFVPTTAVLARRAAIEKNGGFDEDIPGVEDYDLWIRLARDSHFVFVPTPVAVYRHGFQSKHLAEVTDGRFAPLLLRVLQNAVAALPETAAFAPLVQDTRACIDFQTAAMLVFNGQDAAARPLLRAALVWFPALAHGVYARHTLSGFVGQLAVASPSPLAATEAFCREITRAAESRRHGGERWLRLLLGEIWGGVAVHLGFGVRPRDREAAAAALRAVRCSPRILGSRKRLLWLLARGLVGRRLDAIFMAVGLWIQRRTLVRG